MCSRERLLEELLALLDELEMLRRLLRGTWYGVRRLHCAQLSLAVRRPLAVDSQVLDVGLIACEDILPVHLLDEPKLGDRVVQDVYRIRIGVLRRRRTGR